MKFVQTLKTAIKALSSNKVRSALTMLGVIIGVFAVVALISIGRGLQNYITDQFNALGSNLLFVSPGRVDLGGNPNQYLSNNKLEQKHIELINNNAGDYIQVVSPYIETGTNVSYRSKDFYAGVMGVNYQVTEIFDYNIDEGRSFTRSEEASGSRVAVIGPEVKKELFGSRSPLGSSINIGGDSYKIIGVSQEKGRNFDNNVLVPYRASMRTFDIENYSSIVLKVADQSQAELATKQVKRALLRDLKEDEFTVLSQKDILSSIQSILQILTVSLGAIAGISLLVGGIGIMNIMLVSVTERTKEIGLRKALGATPANIGLQFVFESILLSFSGGAVGLLLGWLASLAGRAFVRTEVPLWAIALAFGFSALVGVVFGTYPAVKAAKKDPIEALRFE